jgi:hypothetical protein
VIKLRFVYMALAAVGASLGFCGVLTYAQGASSRVSNGIEPLAAGSALVEVVCGLTCLILVRGAYGEWCRDQPVSLMRRILVGWMALTAIATVGVNHAYLWYTAELPASSDSYFRFYFGTWELWLLGLAVMGAMATRDAVRQD